MTFFTFADPARTYAGVARVVSHITLEAGGNAYNEVSRFEIADPSEHHLLSGQNTGTPVAAASARAFRSAWVSRPREVKPYRRASSKKNPLQWSG
ncbi:hypothetical protein ACI48D_13745 [Massilia sp. LXY-6]|uniref:hypothetical protein n=1 Tax=Massilia sp. LXY-6 TaxID=3379823 RepID=UPI003EE03BC2